MLEHDRAPYFEVTHRVQIPIRPMTSQNAVNFSTQAVPNRGTENGLNLPITIYYSY